MSPPTQEEINALVAKKRAEVLSRMASMNIPVSAPGARPMRPNTAAQQQSFQIPQIAGQRPMARPVRPAANLNRPAAPVSLNTASLQDTIAAAKARIEAKLHSQGVRPPPMAAAATAATAATAASTNLPPQTSSAAPAILSNSQPTELHPMLRADFKSLSSKTARPVMPRISSVKANQRKEEPKRLKIEHEVPASFTDPQKNPYMDPNLGRYTKIEPRQRKHGKKFQFVRPGRYVEQAEKLRAEVKVEQLKAEIRERAAKARLEEEVLDVSAIRPMEPPVIEWWDAPFLREDSYGSGFRLDGPESLVTIYVQHPVPLQPPSSITSSESAASKIFLTQKERKKIRRQRRMEQQREHREKVMLGLLPPDQPKLRMSNFMRIMANQSVPDPTKLEAEVRKQVQARVEKHEAENRANKLTREQRAEKLEAKAKNEETKGIVSVLFRVRSLRHPQHRYKVSVNARQMHLTGTALVCPGISIVLVEGAEKFIKAYKKLLLRRIDWTEQEGALPAGSDAAGSDAVDADAVDADALDADNECHLVWQGQVQERRFKEFRIRDCPTETQAKNWLAGAGCEALWRLAKQLDPENSSLEPLV
ncbi:U4/U5/U6 small nuclear ribonucleoprotein prp3 [Coemansia asiatica]|nr:U4/U5/U6 small nuclear ribonucleoprotein prp3 [Coemansia asiatica]